MQERSVRKGDDAQGGIAQRMDFVSTIGMRWVSADAGELRFVHANEIDTPVAVTDAKARLIWQARPHGLRGGRPSDSGPHVMQISRYGRPIT